MKRNRLIAIILSIALVVSMSVILGLTVSNAETTDISSVEEFLGMDADGNYKLAADITFTEGNTTISSFTGTLDGNGKTVSGITAPLFDTLSGTVSNLTLAGAITSTSTGNVGVLVNTVNNTATITGITNNVSVTATAAKGVGGVIGNVTSGTLTVDDCTNNGAISAKANVGGILGSADGTLTANVTDCVNTASVFMSTGDAHQGCGGIVGYSQNTSTVTIERCLNQGDISESGNDGGTGGIFGCTIWNSGSQYLYVRYCVNEGKISVTTDGQRGRVGGIVGRVGRSIQITRIEYNYNVGEIDGMLSVDGAGGVIGYARNANDIVIKGNYNIGKVSAKASHNCAIGYNGENKESVTSDNFYMAVSPAEGSIALAGGRYVQATKVDNKEALNTALLALSETPYMAAPLLNDGYATLSWQCAHTNKTLQSTTCTDDVYVCDNCGLTIRQTAAVPSEHTWGDTTVKTAATALTNRIDHRFCTVCNEEDAFEVTDTATGIITLVEGVYTVNSAANFEWLAYNVNDGAIAASSSIKLAADIDVSAVEPDGNAYITVAFGGTFDGAGHTISGIGKPLFATVNGATIKDLTVNGEINSTENRIAAIAMTSNSNASTFSGITNNATITGTGTDSNVGSIVGFNSTPNVIYNCVNNGAISLINSAANAAGGIVGWVNSGSNATTITNCTNNGDISGNGTGKVRLGGIVGVSRNAVTIMNCVNNGAIDCSQNTSTQSWAGGIIATTRDNSGCTIKQCSNKAVVTGAISNANDVTGGIIGYAQGGNADFEACTVWAEVSGFEGSTGRFVGGAASNVVVTAVNFVDMNTTSAALAGIYPNAPITEACYSTADITASGEAFTIGGKTYQKYDKGFYLENATGIINFGNATEDDKAFATYISYRDNDINHDVRFMLLANIEAVKALESAKVRITFKNGDDTVKNRVWDMGEVTVYGAINAGGEAYLAADGYAYFGIIVTDIPDGAWTDVELSVVDAADAPLPDATKTIGYSAIIG